MATLDAVDRMERIERAAAFRKECERQDEVDMQVARLCEIAELLARGALTAAGYHRHNRGEWRRRRASKQTAEE